jgi:hypothetical protein
MIVLHWPFTHLELLWWADLCQGYFIAGYTVIIVGLHLFDAAYDE